VLSRERGGGEEREKLLGHHKIVFGDTNLSIKEKERSKTHLKGRALHTRSKTMSCDFMEKVTTGRTNCVDIGKDNCEEGEKI